MPENIVGFLILGVVAGLMSGMFGTGRDAHRPGPALRDDQALYGVFLLVVSLRFIFQL